MSNTLKFTLCAIVCLVIFGSCKQEKSTHLFPVKFGDKWGYVNQNGEKVIQAQFDNAFIFTEGLAIVEKDGKHGFIDTKGKFVLPCKYTSATHFSKGLSIVSTEGSVPMCINSEGEIKFTLQNHKAVGAFSEDLVRSEKFDEKWGFANREGVVVIPHQFIAAHAFSEGLSAVLIDNCNKWGFINTKGELVIQPQFSEAKAFENGYCIVEDCGKWGIIDTTGKYILEPCCEMISPCEGGKFYPFCMRGKWGYLNQEFSTAVEPQFEYATRFYYGIAFVKMNNKWNMIDTNAHINKTEFEAINTFCCNRFVENKYKFTNTSSNTVDASAMTFVDLGLSVNWANCNAGANYPWHNGILYTYPEARKLKGTLPTIEQVVELETECTWTWTQMQGRNGYQVTGKNGNSIFIPASGYRDEGVEYFVNRVGDYWTSTTKDANAYHMRFDEDGEIATGFNNFHYGESVRFIIEK